MKPETIQAAIAEAMPEAPAELRQRLLDHLLAAQTAERRESARRAAATRRKNDEEWREQRRIFLAEQERERQEREEQERAEQPDWFDWFDGLLDRLDAMGKERRAAFEALGIAPGSDCSTIQKAYRRLAAVHHPDTGGDSSQFQRIQYAYRRQ